jgi:hypothetical protein
LIRYSLTLGFLAILASCVTQEQRYDSLSPDEQEYIRQRASILCQQNSAQRYEEYKRISDEQFSAGDSNSFYRNKNWEVQFKSGTNVTETWNINVWKVATNTVFFILTEDFRGAIKYKFIKVDSTTNQEMISDLLLKKCTKALTITDSSTSAVVSRESVVDVDGNTRHRFRTTNTFPFSQLAYFGLLNETRTKEVLDRTNRDRVTSTEQFSTTISRKTDVAPAYSTYTSYPPASTQFCTLKVTAGTPNSYTFPYEQVCSASDVAGPIGWANPSGDL